jgi:hypothetical protein
LAAKPSVESPVRGSNRAVRSIKRSLWRRYSAVRKGGTGRAEPFEIGAKAMEAVKSLEAQPRGTPRRMGHGTFG